MTKEGAYRITAKKNKQIPQLLQYSIFVISKDWTSKLSFSVFSEMCIIKVFQMRIKESQYLCPKQRTQISAQFKTMLFQIYGVSARIEMDSV
jgi:hypothetical protein